MTEETKDAVKAYLAEIGRKGGVSGTGDKKRRSREHYKRMAAIRNAKRKGKKKPPKIEELAGV